MRSDTDRAISKHLVSDLHKNNLARKRPIKGVVYNCKQLERLCKVNKVYYYGKMKSRFTKGGMIVGSKNAFKKAVIDLVEGDSIDFYSNV